MQVETPKALVVDDNEVIRLQLSRALVNEGVACDSAINGEDALKKCAEYPYRVVVTDMRMPKVHGHALAVQLLAMPLPPRIVAVTAVTDKRLVQDLKSRGVDVVLHKPLNYSYLARTARRLLDEALEQQADSEPQPASFPDDAIVPASTPPLVDHAQESAAGEARECTWMQLALDYIDWRRLPNPLSVVQDVANAAPDADSTSPTEPVERIAVVVGIGDRGQPLGVPFKVMMRPLCDGRVRLLHTTRLDFARAVVMWRSRQRGRSMAMIEDLKHREFLGGWEVEGLPVRIGSQRPPGS